MSDTITLHPVADKLSEIRRQLSNTYLERNDAILAMILAVLSGEHVFLLGPPGTAKSQLVRALVRCFINARHFECALSKTRPVEAVLGPLNIKEFRENGNYFLKREGYASQVEFLFLDEIGKMSPVLGHDLLALLNERIYHEVNGGLSTHAAPLSTAFTASNEMVTDDSDDAAALWDRLLIRVMVDYLQDSDNFAALLTADISDPDVTIDWADLKQAIDVAVPAVGWSDPALRGMVSLRHEFARNMLFPGDRRWRQTVKVLQAHAFLNGRSEILEDDLAVLRFCLWDTVEQIEKVSRLCMIAANPFVERLLTTREGIVEVDNAITERTGLDPQGQNQDQARRAYGREANDKLGIVRDQLDALLMEAAGRPIPGFKAVSDEHKRVLRRVFMVCLDQTEAEAEVMMRANLPNGGTRLGQGDGGNL